MRRVIYGAACSLDGFIARLDHGVDWLHWSSEVAAISQASLHGVDTIVMGRKTFEVARRAGSGSYAGFKNLVFSRTLQPEATGDIELIAEDAVTVIGRLKSGAGGGICVLGGGELAADLLDADLIDEVGVNVHPVLLGRGIPMFPSRSRQVDLELIEARPIERGCVYALYRVARPASTIER
jgi:dihydrofolate reductase